MTVTPPVPVFAAFDRGQIPTIAVFNKAKTAMGVDFTKLIAALQEYVNSCIVPVWGTPAHLIQTSDFVANAWAIEFLDDADSPGALAYHDLTPGGLPLSKVFVKTTLQAGDQVSVSASHELVEMLVDPAINIYSTGANPGEFLAYESADAVEETQFDVLGIPMSNFVYPSFFEGFRKPLSTKFDYMGKLTKPFELLPGGYQIIFKNGDTTQVFGSEEKANRFAREDRRQHRSELRQKKIAAAV